MEICDTKLESCYLYKLSLCQGFGECHITSLSSSLCHQGIELSNRQIFPGRKNLFLYILILLWFGKLNLYTYLNKQICLLGMVRWFASHFASTFTGVVRPGGGYRRVK